MRLSQNIREEAFVRKDDKVHPERRKFDGKEHTQPDIQLLLFPPIQLSPRRDSPPKEVQEKKGRNKSNGNAAAPKSKALMAIQKKVPTGPEKGEAKKGTGKKEKERETKTKTSAGPVIMPSHKDSQASLVYAAEYKAALPFVKIMRQVVGSDPTMDLSAYALDYLMSEFMTHTRMWKVPIPTSFCKCVSAVRFIISLQTPEAVASVHEGMQEEIKSKLLENERNRVLRQQARQAKIQERLERAKLEAIMQKKQPSSSKSNGKNGEGAKTKNKDAKKQSPAETPPELKTRPSTPIQDFRQHTASRGLRRAVQKTLGHLQQAVSQIKAQTREWRQARRSELTFTRRDPVRQREPFEVITITRIS